MKKPNLQHDCFSKAHHSTGKTPGGVRRFRLLTLWILTVAVPAPPLYAQAQKLTLDRAITIAIQNNPYLEASRLEVDRSDAVVREAWGTAMPRIDLTANYTHALKKPVFFLPDFLNPGSGNIIPIEIGATHSVDMIFYGEQILFDAAVFIGVGAAKTYSQASREGFRASQLDVVTNTRNAFYGVLVAKEVVALMRENIQYSQENLDNVRILYDQGLVSEYDRLRAEVTVENIRPELINAENAFLVAINNLKNAIGISYDTEIQVEGKLDYQPVPDSLIATAQKAVLESNASLAALRLQAEVNDAIASVQRTYYLPTVSAFGNYVYQAQKNAFTLSTNDFITSSVIGLTFRLNIFEGFQTNARVEQAELEYRKTQEQVQSLELGLQTATEKAILELNKARQRIESQGRTVEQAERGHKIATTRYNSGQGTQLEVNDAQLALATAKVNRIEAVFQYTIATNELERLLGRLPHFVVELEEQHKSN
jgi:outer membrane protein TolC